MTSSGVCDLQEEGGRRSSGRFLLFQAIEIVSCVDVGVLQTRSEPTELILFLVVVVGGGVFSSHY